MHGFQCKPRIKSHRDNGGRNFYLHYMTFHTVFYTSAKRDYAMDIRQLFRNYSGTYWKDSTRVAEIYCEAVTNNAKLRLFIKSTWVATAANLHVKFYSPRKFCTGSKPFVWEKDFFPTKTYCNSFSASMLMVRLGPETLLNKSVRRQWLKAAARFGVKIPRQPTDHNDSN